MVYSLINANKIRFLKAIVALSLFWSHLNITAQTFYSVDPDYLKYKLEGNNLTTAFRSVYPDTTMQDLHNFLPRNFLGNVGLSSPDYALKYGTDPLGFRFFQAPIQADKFNEEQMPYYTTKGPYADLTGIAGSKQLQFFKLNFSHTFRERLNFTLKFNRYNSEGFYRHQQSYANNVLFNSNYITKKGRFGYYLYVLNNLNKNRENGGIKDETLNDSTVLINKGLLDVNLDSAARENRESKLMFNPWFKLNGSRDSLSGRGHYLELKSHYSSNKYRYRDQAINKDDFYSTFYYDTLRTNDSSHVKKFSNSLSYTFLNKNQFAFSTGYKNEFNAVWQKTDSLFMNQIITSGLVYRKKLNTNDTLIKNQTELECVVDAQYIFDGVNQGDVRFESKNTLFLKGSKTKNVYLNLLFENRKADYIYNNWNSNHFIWRNNYTSQNHLQAILGTKMGKHFSAFALYQSIGNYLYFDSQALPQQSDKKIQNVSVNLNYSTIFFKHLGFSLNHVFQSTSQTSLLRLPQNTSAVKLFFYANIFNKNLQLHLGTQLQWYQSFTAYDFMPATQTYNLNGNYKTDNFPYVDVYLNLRIRPATFFLKIENILAGYAGNNFALVPGYYQPAMAFRFGLSWMFFD